MSRIDVDKIWKIYDGDVVGVRDLSFTCENKEFLAILGPSGGGKSSTLRMLAGLEAISRGEVSFDGKPVTTLGPAERNVALAFESYALYQRLTVYENIAFPLRAKKVNNAEITKKVKEMAELMDLTSILNKFPSSLAGGQQQRVSLARAFIRKPNLTLLDEPISHMDQRVRMELRARIRRLHDDLGLTTIYVTHDQAEATSLCDRLLIINKAERQQLGTVDEIWHQPANKFVAYFVGEPSMNFIPGVVESLNTVAVLTGQGKKVFRFEGELNPSAVGKEVTIGVRPQEVKVSRSAAEGDVTLRGTVKVVEFQGYNTILTFDLEDKVKTEAKAVVTATQEFKKDEVIHLTVNPEIIHLFDKEVPILKRKLQHTKVSNY